MNSISIDAMKAKDIDGVMLIEQSCFSVPWSRDSFYLEVEENKCARYFIARVAGVIAGYGGMWIVYDEAHITNIAVHPDFRRLGIGSLLLEKLLSEAINICINSITLEVRCSNIPAISLYKKYGFKEAGIRKKYYSDNNEDALIMWNYDIRGWMIDAKYSSY